jgi:beta-glucanase (GH16 family)
LFIKNRGSREEIKLPDYSFRKLMTYDFYTDFHVYGLLWRPKKLVWFMDSEIMEDRMGQINPKPE